jgi:drug/metabolite transporter (DMT)-like permease
MSVMGMVLGSLVLGDQMTLRRVLGIAVVLIGLVLVSGVNASSLTLRASLGDAMFFVAGTLWAGFGIVSRKHRLDPLLATSVISISALFTYVPAYFWFIGASHLMNADLNVLLVEVVVQGVIAGVGTLYTYSKLVSLLGPSRAAVFPALAPGLAALMAWPVLGHVPVTMEAIGLLLVMVGLIVAVTVSTVTSDKT